jgi:hypothetical protein
MEFDVELTLPVGVAREIVRLVEEDGPRFKRRRFTEQDLAKRSSAEIRSWSARRLCVLDASDSGLGSTVAEFAVECFARLGLSWSQERVFGNFIGVQYPGAWVQAHTDPVSDLGWWHLRLNFLVQKPDAGGEVRLGDFVIEPEEGAWWLNFASSRVHACSPVLGDRARVILSLGTYVEPEVGARLLRDYESVLSGSM